ncbi:MAG: hypothetical protein QOJ86_5163 [Bradyrhizobium sp.]|nr:hypothetical protein [Bradyrhizobium sp.]
MQRAALREALLRRTGTVPNAGVRDGPGSAAHRSARAPRCAASGARKSVRACSPERSEIRVFLPRGDIRPGSRWAPSGLRQIFLRNLKIPIDGIPTLLYIFRVLFEEGPLSTSDPFSGQSGKLAGPGRPGTVDGLVVGGALGGAAPSLGRARSPCRARWAHPPPPRVPRKHPGASHRSIAPAGFAGGGVSGKPRTQCAARTRKCGCLKFRFGSRERGRATRALNTAAPSSHAAPWPPRSTTQDHPRTAETPAKAACRPRRSARPSRKASARSGRR